MQGAVIENTRIVYKVRVKKKKKKKQNKTEMITNIAKGA